MGPSSGFSICLSWLRSKGHPKIQHFQGMYSASRVPLPKPGAPTGALGWSQPMWRPQMGGGGRHRHSTDLSTTPWLSAKWENTEAVGTPRRPLTPAEGGQGRRPGGEHHLHGPWRKSGLTTVSMRVMAALKIQRVV